MVDQTYANLAAGGKYHHLLGSAALQLPGQVRRRGRPRGERAARSTSPRSEPSTRRTRRKGARLIFKSEIDTAEESTWEALKLRARRRRQPPAAAARLRRGTQPHRSADGSAAGAGARRADRRQRDDAAARPARHRDQTPQGRGLDRRRAGHRGRRESGRRFRAGQERDPCSAATRRRWRRRSTR